MSWANSLFCNKYFGSWARWLANHTLQAGGPIPQHVAFIMDGNRRFARKNKQEIIQGHDLGGNKFKETLEWCHDLGIRTVSAFAFSIENFKRSKEEVDQLMVLLKDKLVKFIPELSTKTKIKFLGDITLLPEDIQSLIADAMLRSKHITGYTLNICFGYTSTDEMTRATMSLAEGVKKNLLQPSDIDIDLFEECLDTHGCTKPDVIIRTSGEIRLSDFMLWQSAYSCLIFCDALWPEFSVINLYNIILQFQKNYPQLQEMRQFSESIEKKNVQLCSK